MMNSWAERYKTQPVDVKAFETGFCVWWCRNVKCLRRLPCRYAEPFWSLNIWIVQSGLSPGVSAENASFYACVLSVDLASFPLEGNGYFSNFSRKPMSKPLYKACRNTSRSIWRRPLPASNKAYNLSAATSIMLYRFLIPACFPQQHYYPVWLAKHSQSCPWFATK